MLGDIFEFFCVLFLVLIVVVAWSSRGSRKKRPEVKTVKNSLEYEPFTIQPIVAAVDDFDLSPYTIAAPSLPETKDSLLSIQKDADMLRQYAGTLDDHLKRTEKAVHAAISKFEFDHAELVNQQLQIYRRVYQTKRTLACFPELSGNELSEEDIPAIFRVRIPRKPAYPTPKDLQQKYSLPSAQAVGHTFGKLLGQNGGVRNSDNVKLAVVIAAGLVIKGRSDNSKMKRVLEDVRGRIANYCQSLKTTVSILDKAHTDLVMVSINLKRSEIVLIDMIDKVGAIGLEITGLDQVSPDMRRDLYLLNLLLLKAEQYSKNPL